MRRIAMVLIACTGLLATPVFAGSGSTETYDLLFRNGTLDDMATDRTLVYDRTVTNSIDPGQAERNSGRIVLGVADTDPPQARLQFRQGEKHRNLGAFPASVGNPIIMYFVETVVRDMAATAGGSPFYIRNRVKEALVQPAEVSHGQAVIDGKTVSTIDVTMRPFHNDPNAARMRGFDQLALTVTMSDEVPGWYLVLGANVPGAGNAKAIYSSVMRFEGVEAAQ